MKETIIEPVAVELLLKELTQSKFVRTTKKGGYEVYLTTMRCSPNVMREIGRLREITFRNEGGGTGKACDIDPYDKVFQQLILWNPKDQRIVGGYRLARMQDLKIGNVPFSPTEEIFDFSKSFIKNYMKDAMELGRSFIIPEYQKSIFALEGLFDGLGAIVGKQSQMKYLFGKVTMYPKMKAESRNIILHFIEKFFPDKEELCTARFPLPGISYDLEALSKKSPFILPTYEENLTLLIKMVKAMGEVIPPLLLFYMGLTKTMKSCGMSISPSFGDVHEVAILVNISDISEEKRRRYIPNYA